MEYPLFMVENLWQCIPYISWHTYLDFVKVLDKFHLIIETLYFSVIKTTKMHTFSNRKLVVPLGWNFLMWGPIYMPAPFRNRVGQPTTLSGKSNRWSASSAGKLRTRRYVSNCNAVLSVSCALLSLSKKHSVTSGKDDRVACRPWVAKVEEARLGNLKLVTVLKLCNNFLKKWSGFKVVLDSIWISN